MAVCSKPSAPPGEVPSFQRPDRCRLHYEIHGRGEPLVLLEGLGGDIPGWRRNIPTLSAELLVVAYDFRGNGRSDKPDERMTMQTFVDDTVGLLDHLGIGSAHFYGQSFGGMVAQELALSHSNRVRALVLACTHAGLRTAVRVAEKVPKDRPWLALYSPEFAVEHPDHVADDLRVGRQNPQPPHAARRQREAMQDFDAYDRLEDIVAPTLVLHGAADRVIHPDNARMLAERIPNARLVLLAGAGHVYHSEQSEAADRAVLDFIKELTR
jgi:pimeloyl-ACP methyl ester carboxylesterase